MIRELHRIILFDLPDIQFEQRRFVFDPTMATLESQFGGMLANSSVLLSVVVGILFIVGIVAAFSIAKAFNSWLQAQLRGVPIPFLQIVGFVFRKSDVGAIVHCYAKAKDAGLDVQPGQIEVQQLAGGRPEKVLKAVIEAIELGVDLDWDGGCAVDLAGRDPLDFVRISAETGCNIVEYAQIVPSSQRHLADPA
jgi:uncharacterized protein YqfA (UPF0365 family)